MALLRREFGLEDRVLHLFDTFEGFPKGSFDSRRGKRVKGPARPNFYDAVVANLELTCGTEDVVLHVGPVERTLEGAETGSIALLRLDTDHYSSTRTDLEILYPRRAGRRGRDVAEPHRQRSLGRSEADRSGHPAQSRQESRRSNLATIPKSFGPCGQGGSEANQGSPPRTLKRRSDVP
jgi:hypothetical protein